MKKVLPFQFKVFMEASILRTLIILLLSASPGSICVRAQDSNLTKTTQRSECRQEKKEKLSLIQKAEVDQYNVLHIEFLGNSRFSGRHLFKRTKPILDEGDIFTRQNLESAIGSVGKMRGIYPVTLDNVVIRLIEADRRINILFCLDEKPKK